MLFDRFHQPHCEINVLVVFFLEQNDESDYIVNSEVLKAICFKEGLTLSQ